MLDIPVRGAGDAECLKLETVTLRGGAAVTIRPVRTDDGPRLKAFFAQLSPETVFSRFLAYRKELPQQEVDRLVQADHRTRMVLVATLAQREPEDIVAVASYDVLQPTQPELAEAAIVIEDQYQGRGLGTRLTQRLAACAQAHGIRAFLASVHHDDVQIMQFLRRTGLPIESRLEAGVWEIKVYLEAISVTETP